VPGYEVLDVLGRGGMGVVYQARQKGLKRLVALKMVRDQALAGPVELARFRAEAETLASLQHPNIVQVYEVGEFQGRPFLSLEFVGGGSLDRRLAGGPLPADLAGRLVETLARAMDAAHRKGIIHRDLKPANVLLAGEPDTPLAECTLKITDFGLAKQLEQDTGHTRSGAIMGTPSYMAPEQAQGKVHELTAVADLYSLGAILYELLTGRAPFKGATVWETIAQVRSQEPVSPRQLQPGVPRDLETICLKCLQKEPRKRYADALALAEDLRRFQAGEPILARPAGKAERLVKWARRRPGVAALAGGLVVAAVGLLTGFAWHYFDLQRQIGRALAAEQETRAKLDRANRAAEVERLVAGAQEALTHDAPDVWQRAASVLAREVGRSGPDASHGPGLTEAREVLDRLQARLTEHEARQAAAARYQAFHRHRHDALLYGSHFAGEDVPGQLRRARQAARQGLAAFGLDADPAAGLALDTHAYRPGQPEEIRDGCYELLIILASALAEPQPGEDPSAQARQALLVLEQARRLRGGPTPAYHLGRAECQTRLGEPGAAETERRLAEKVAPEAATDFFLLGYERYRRDDLAGALRDFEAVLQRQPDHFWAQYLSAVCLLRPAPGPAEPRRGRLSAAKYSLLACAAREKDFPWIYVFKGYVHAELAEYAEAEADFRKAETLPLDTGARYTLLVNRATLHFRRAERGDPKEYDRAVADLRQAVGLRPSEVMAHVNLAQVFQARQAYPQAAAELDEAIRLKPGLVLLYRNRARLRLKSSDWDGALTDLDRAIALAGVPPPADPAARRLLADDHFRRGLIVHRRKRYAEALEAFRRAAEADPSHHDALLCQAWTLAELHRRKEALQAFDGYLRLGKAAPEVYAVRAQMWAEAGDRARAVEDATRALAMRPEAATFALRGWIYLQYNVPVLAERDFDQALRLEPTNAEAFGGRGYARVKLGQYRRGVQDVEESLRRAPARPELVYSAARAYAVAVAQVEAEARGRSPGELRGSYQDRAVQLLQRALDLHPAPERAGFWKATVLQDAAFRSVRSSPAFARLAAMESLRKPVGPQSRGSSVGGTP
jgi:tetratricopeptide (TPR) repeat protein/tRNA A-37 threonylcarbamoyl transferase component Bud32